MGTLYLTNGDIYTGGFSMDLVHGKGLYYKYFNFSMNIIEQIMRLLVVFGVKISLNTYFKKNE